MRLLALLSVLVPLAGCDAHAAESECPTLVIYVRGHLSDGSACDVAVPGACCPDGWEALGWGEGGTVICAGSY